MKHQSRKPANPRAAEQVDISDRRSPAEHVQTWLNKDGAALEMEVASKILVGPSTVEHSGYFRDAKTGALSVFDVHATFRQRTFVPSISFEIHALRSPRRSDASDAARGFRFPAPIRTLPGLVSVRECR